MSKLNHSLTIERSTDGARDERGVPVQTWASIATVMASVQPLTDKDLMQLSQGGPTAATLKVYLLGTPDVTEADRLIEGTQVLQIDGKFDQAGAGHHLRLNCHEVNV